jgi:hypothetical protein
MNYVLFLVSLFIYVALLRAKAYYDNFGANSYQDRLRKFTPTYKWKISIIKGLAEFMLIFCIVAFIFSIFQYWLDTTTNIDTTKATLLKIEQLQATILVYAGYFNFNFYINILVWCLIIVLCGMFPVVAKWDLDNKYRKYSKFIKNVIYFLTISTSFTFFGIQMSENERATSNNLQIHKLKIIKDKQLLAHEIQNEVTRRIVNRILLNPRVSNILDQLEEIQLNIKQTKEEAKYKSVALLAQPGFLNQFQVNTFESEYKSKYNFAEQISEANISYKGANSQTSDDFQFSEKASENPKFSKSTEQTIKKARQTFATASKHNRIKFSKFYSKFKDPLETIIKKVYSSTGAAWLSSFMKSLGADFPFLDQFLDVIVNDKMEEWLIRKCSDLSREAEELTEEQIITNINELEEEFDDAFQSTLNQNEKFNELHENIIDDVAKSRLMSDLTHADLVKVEGNSKIYLQEICKVNNLEVVRIKFYRNLLNDQFPRLPETTRTKSLAAFSNWERHKKENALQFYITHVTDIDAEFFTFCKDDPHLLATWAYCLLAYDNSLSVPLDALNFYFTLHNESYSDFFDSIDYPYKIPFLELIRELCPK